MLIRYIALGLLILLLSGCQPAPQGYQGYVEVQYTYVAPEYSGILEKLLVSKGMQVKAGMPLFILEAQPESDELRKAQNKLLQAKAQQAQFQAALVFEEIRLQRQQALYKKQATALDNVDLAQSNFDQARANLAAAIANVAVDEAALSQAQWTRNKKTVNSPADGFVFDTFFVNGEVVDARHPVLSLVKPENVYVVFYVPEPILGSLKLDQIVHVNCSGCKKTYTAKIYFISPSAEYTPPVIFSNQTNYKLLYRIEAWPSDNHSFLLHPGQPVMVKIPDG